MKLVNLTCPNCGAPLEKIGDNLCCNACGGAFAIDYDDADVEHEKLQTEDERAAREFEHEKEMMEIKHRQLEESRIAAEKRENKRKSQERLGRAVKNKISGLITLVIIVGFFFGCYKLSVHWGIVPPMSEIIESAKQEAKDPYDFTADEFTSDVNKEMIAAAIAARKKTDEKINSYEDGEWVDFYLNEVECEGLYYIQNASESNNRVVVIMKVTYNSDIGDKVLYDAYYFTQLKLTDGKVVCGYKAYEEHKSNSAWHGAGFDDKDQCYREGVLAYAGTISELKVE